MENCGALSLQSCGWLGLEKGRAKAPELLFSDCWEKRNVRVSKSQDLRMKLVPCKSRAAAPIIKNSCSSKDSAVPFELKAKNLRSTDEEALILKEKAREVAPYLNGACIYLVGMMGSGKTTVGKILSESLGYYFFDSDKLVEQAVGGATVAQIFKEYSEEFFRENESKVLKDLCMMRRLVVATGGGAVIRPINWRYMKRGVTVWLDVPLEALARRIAAVGTNSRPLLHHDSGDAYTKALLRLSALSEERGEAYANSDATVSLQSIAWKQGHGDVSALTPTAIAIEALIKIGNFVNWKEGNGQIV
ncbi:shikimate kinase 3, chloroplastic-like [Nymphaea colorata]|nr:shikimate kinase 3, chloroplastic-like [Nymphaea colorata]